ncbi:MAG TPA: DUF4349 domain-containing protein [Actinomycetota bacterium]|nr:DUF4349 domain-containing protein [Actinomycetota bacterium]
MRSRHVALVLLLLGVLVAGCSSSDGDAMDAPATVEGGADEGGSGGGGSGHAAQRAIAEDSAAGYTTETEALAVTDDGGDTWAAAPTLPERVIKTADLQLEVGDGRLGATLREGRAIAEGAGGFVLSTSVDGVDRRRGEFTIRVPAERFEETLTALEELGTIAGEDVRGEDVSQEFVDLEARLRNATAQEEVLFRLYDRSSTIGDTIRVQRELEDVQLEIERLRGRLRFLEDRTDLSTISVSVVESGAVTAEAGPFERAWDTARKTFVAVVSGAIVGAGFLLPIAVFALLAYLVFRLVRPRLQRATP